MNFGTFPGDFPPYILGAIADIRPIKKTAGNVPHVQAHRYISCRFLCSSHCLNEKKEARDGIRTRGPRLGKAMLHH